MPTLRKIDSILVVALLVMTTWILLTSGVTLLSLSTGSEPGSIKLDWHDEINRMEGVLNYLIPIATLVLGSHFVIVPRIGCWKPVVLFYEVIGFVSATFVAIAVWNLIARAHGPNIDLWNLIWWW